MNSSAPAPRPARTRLQRWLLVALGVVSVGVGGIGVFVPGLPTTVFLLAASWCFARSCPWLEERLVRVRLFRPFLASLEPGARMPLRALLTTLAVMWLAVGTSAALLSLGEPSRPALAAFIVALGLVGTFFVMRLHRRPQSEAPGLLDDGEGESPVAAD
jgi:uncharacterized membrane protein YbaN (DUF454 family)